MRKIPGDYPLYINPNIRGYRRNAQRDLGRVKIIGRSVRLKWSIDKWMTHEIAYYMASAWSNSCR